LLHSTRIIIFFFATSKFKEGSNSALVRVSLIPQTDVTKNGVVVVVAVIIIVLAVLAKKDSLCSSVHGYRSKRPGSIPGVTTFSEKYWVWNVVHSAS
jgi:hypothetical protein